MAAIFRELKCKYSKLSKPKRATLWITLSSFMLRGISFITLPIFTRLLSTDEYGSVSVYQSWESIFVYVVTLGIAYGGFNNGMVRYPDDREGYTTSVMGLICTMGLLWGTLTFVFPGVASSLLGMSDIYIVLMLVQVVASEVYDVWACRARYDFEYRKVVAAAIILSIGVPALGIPLVIFSDDKVFARIVAMVFVYVGIAIAVGSATLKRSKHFCSIEYWKFTICFNVPLLPHYLSQVVLNSSDRIMIGQMCSASDAGIYSIAYSAGMIMTVLTSSLSSTVMPWLYRQLEEKNYKRVGEVGLELLGFLAGVILIMDVLAPDIVAILAPASYGEAMELVPVIAASVYYIFLYSFCSNIEFFYEETKIATVASVLAAVLNVCLNFIFIPQYGYQAAGYTTLACYLILAIAHYASSQRITSLHAGKPVLDGKVVWLMASLLMGFSIIFSRLYRFPIARYCILITMVVLCLIKRKALANRIRDIKAS